MVNNGFCVSIVMGVPLYRWMVFVNGKIPSKIWMMTGGTPMTQETTKYPGNFPTIFWLTKIQHLQIGPGHSDP